MSEVDVLERELEADHPQQIKMTVLGWGALQQHGFAARVLNYVNLPYVDRETCRRAMYPHRVFDNMICAGDIKYGGVDACQGDSGGPLVIKRWREDNKQNKTTSTDENVREGKTFLFDFSHDIHDLFVDRNYDDNDEYQYPDDDTKEIVEKPHAYELAGLVSWGVGCGQKNYAGVYTDIASFKDWIDEIMRKS